MIEPVILTSIAVMVLAMSGVIQALSIRRLKTRVQELESSLSNIAKRTSILEQLEIERIEKRSIKPSKKARKK